MRSLRFGHQLAGAADGAELVARARAAEAAGFDVVHTWDHLGHEPHDWPPLTPLATIAAATERIRLCPLVLNNDFHHPVHLARELVALDRLSGGRLEVGIGAGHSAPEYAAVGRAFDPPAVRKARMAEAVAVLAELLAGRAVTHDGAHYQFEGAAVGQPTQDHVPILVGVSGRDALARAAATADIIGLTGLGRTLPDGHRHTVNWDPGRLDATIAHLCQAAGERWDQLELNALVQAVIVTDDRRVAAAELASRVEGLTTEHALEAPFVAIGTHDEIADHLLRCRDRWNISYFSARIIDDLAPVIDLVRGR